MKWLYLLPACMLISMAHATSWPTFTPPSLSFLMNNNMINTADCPAGEGKITPKLALNIQRYFCRLNCPSIWEWKLADDQSCHPINTDFNFQRYEFNYTRQGEGENETLYTEITAFYGKIDSNEPTFKFTFISQKDDHWQCIEMNPELHSVICADDMLRRIHAQK